MKKDNKHRLRRMFSDAKSEKTFIIEKYETIGRHTLPYTNVHIKVNTSVNKQSRIIEPVIIDSWKQLVNFIMNTMLGGGSWANMILDEQIFNQIVMEIPQIQKNKYKELQSQLDSDNEKTFNYINNSNANRAIYKAMVQAVNLGTGAFKLVERPELTNPFSFQSVDITELLFTEDAYGKPENVFREYCDIKKEDILQLFQGVKLKGERDKYSLVESIEKIKEGEYIHRLTDASFNDIMYEKKLPYNPFTVFRWDVSQNNVYGIGIGFELIDEFERLAEFKEFQRQSAKLNVFPPLAFTGAIEHMNKINYGMGKISYLGSSNDIAGIQPLGIGSNYMSMENEIQKSEQLIRSAYISNPLGDYEDRANVTASEVESRMEIFDRMFAGTYELLQDELLKHMFMNVFRLLISRGMLSFPYEYIDYINLKYTNKQSESTNKEIANNIIQYRGIALQYYPQEAGVALDNAWALEEIRKRMGIPEDATLSLDDMRTAIAQQQQMAQQQQEQELAQQQAQTEQISNGG